MKRWGERGGRVGVGGFDRTNVLSRYSESSFIESVLLSISGEPAFLLYIVGYEIRKLTLHDGVETTLLHWKGLGDSQALSIDYHYKENRMYWADSHSIHRSFLNGSGQ